MDEVDQMAEYAINKAGNRENRERVIIEEEALSQTASDFHSQRGDCDQSVISYSSEVKQNYQLEAFQNQEFNNTNETPSK